MKKQLAIKIAGYITLLLFLFHLPFYWMFGWETSLACLNPTDYGILMCFNVICIALLFIMAFVSLKKTKKLINTALGKILCTYFSFFYVFRIVAEFLYFQHASVVESTVIIFLCSIPATGYLLPLLRTKSIK